MVDETGSLTVGVVANIGIAQISKQLLPFMLENGIILLTLMWLNVSHMMEVLDGGSEEETMKNRKELRLKELKSGELGTELLTMMCFAGTIFSLLARNLISALVFSIGSLAFVALSIVFHVAIERTKKE